MRPCKAILIAVLLLAQGAVADSVWLRKGGRVVHGWIDRVDDVAIRMRLWEGTAEAVEFHRDEVLYWRRTIEPERLEQLSPDRPESYLRMAEELSAETGDPAARALAGELALIALQGSYRVRARRETARRSWLMLFQLLMEPAERERLIRFGAGQGFVAERRPQEESPGRGDRDMPAFPAVSGTELAAWLADLRRGGGRLAGRAPPAGADEWLRRMGSPVRAEELAGWGGSAELSPAQLLFVLDLEARLEGGPDSGGELLGDWMGASVRSATAVDDALSPRNITSFDPLRAWWRNGSWTDEPGPGKTP